MLGCVSVRTGVILGTGVVAGVGDHASQRPDQLGSGQEKRQDGCDKDDVSHAQAPLPESGDSQPGTNRGTAK